MINKVRLLGMMTAVIALSGCIDPVKAPYVPVQDLTTAIN
jgi:hypothetical protein